MTSAELFVRLLGSVREHLATHPVASRIASVEVTTTYLDGERTTVQLSGDDLADLATVLLGWADTLTQVTATQVTATNVTATAWRPPDGEWVHLIITGHLPDGVALQVYGGVRYTESVFGADLQPGGRQSVALSVLRSWAAGGAVAA